MVVWSPGHGPAGGRRPGLPAHLPAALVVPAQLQHGRQPGRPAGPRRRPGPARAVVRAVPGQRRGGRAWPGRSPATTEAIAVARQRAMQCHLGRHRVVPGPARTTWPPPRRRWPGRAPPGDATRPPATWPELRRGDVIEVPTGRRAGLAVVLDPGRRPPTGTARPLVVTAGRWAGRLTAADFRGPVPALGRIRLGKFTDHRSPKVRRDVASALASSGISAPTGPARTAANRSRRST